MPNQPVFGTLYTLDRFVYRQNSTLLYCTIKEIIILKIACFGVIYVPFSRVITRYYVYFFTRVITGVATHLNARFIATLVGKIISTGLALGPMSRIMTRSLYVLLWSRHAWCEHLEINRGVQRELEFWRSSSCVAQHNGGSYR